MLTSTSCNFLPYGCYGIVTTVTVVTDITQHNEAQVGLSKNC